MSWVDPQAHESLANKLAEVRAESARKDAEINGLSAKLAKSELASEKAAAVLSAATDHGHGWVITRQSRFLACPICKALFLLAPHKMDEQVRAIFEESA